jgi:hypothetical protein
MLALPALWYGGLSIMLATLPLMGARSIDDLRRTGRDARTQVEAAIGRLAGRRSRKADPLDTRPTEIR